MAVVTIRAQLDSKSLALVQSDFDKFIKGLNNKTITFNMTGDTQKNLKAFASAMKEYNVSLSRTVQLEKARVPLKKAQIEADRDIRVETERTTQANKRLETQIVKRETAEARANEESVSGLKQTNKAAAQTGDTIGKLAGKVALWAAATTLIYAPIRAFEEALDTMREVDDTLVEVRKVTNFTGEQMKALEKQAYDVASAYGESADAYLSSVAEFARAGYQEQSAALAELSLKTQIVGDVTAETANQFLLSVDAAYKLGGSITELSKVLDGANEIDNKYATSIEKIAEGLGIVAPVAAQAGIGIDEMTAAIGTITAVTQRSGSEAARAYRALILNILGDTKTEIDEGVTWTTGEIAGLKDVIKEYAPEVYRAAQATGELINPMEAIGALAQAMKDGLLTETELMEQVSDIGGKLRTSQLLALIQRWDMYEDMLSDYAGAMGSADKEVENALDSWSRKLNVLQNTWTKFVSNLVETDVIKGALDAVTVAVGLLDSGLGRAIVTAVAFTAAFKGISKILSAVNLSMPTFVSDLGLVIKALFKSKEATDNFVGALGFLKAAFVNSPVAWVAAFVAVIGALKSAKDYLSDLNETSEEHLANAEKLRTEYETLYGEGTEFAELEKNAKNLTEAEKNRYETLKLQTSELEDQIRLEQEIAYKKSQSNQSTLKAGVSVDAWGQYTPDEVSEMLTTKGADSLDQLRNKYKDLSDQYSENAVSAEEYTQKLRDLLKAEVADYEQLQDFLKAGVTLKDYDKERIELADDIIGKIVEIEEEAGIAAEETAADIKAQIETLGSLQAELGATSAAVEDFNKRLEGGEKGDTFKDLAEIYEGFLEKFNAGLIGSNELQAAVEMFLPDSVIDSLRGDWAAAGELLASDFWQAVFSQDGEDYGAVFANALQEFADESGNIVDSNGEIVASFENIDGAISANIESAEGLAEVLGTTPEVIYAIMDAWDIYSGEAAYDVEELIENFRRFDGVVTEAADNIRTIDVTELAANLKALNIPTGQIWNMIDALKEADNVQLTNVPERLENVEAKAIDAEGQLEDLDETEVSPTISADTDKWDSAYSRILNNINRLNNTPVVIGIKQGGSISSFAEGTKAANGGLALVNDGNGPELIAANGRAYIAGGGEPTVTALPKGARVYTAEETRKILGGTIIKNSIPAFARGFNNIPVAGGSGHGTSGGTRPSASGSISEKAEDIYEDMKDALDETLKDMEHQIFLWEIKGNMTSAIVNQYRAMQNKLHELAERYRAEGLDENSDYIQELQKQWWDYEEEIKAIAEDLWDELEDAVDKQLEQAEKIKDAEIAAIDAQIEAIKETAEKEDELLELEEKRLAVAEAQEALLKAQAERTIRIYNGETGQWEWVADRSRVEDAQENLKDAQEALDEFIRDKERDEKIAALEERKEAIEAQFDAYEQMWEAITDSVADPTRDISDILADISKNGLPAMKEAVTKVTDLLLQLGNYEGAAVSGDTGGSIAGGNSGAVKDYKNDTTDYAALMLAAPDEKTFNYYAAERLKKIEAQNIDLKEKDWEDNQELKSMWEASKKYDSGGILKGMGGIKATEQDEIILPPDLTKAMLSPQSNAVFQDRISKLGYLFGSTPINLTAGMTSGTGQSVTHNGGPYYFGNIEISEKDAETLTIAELARRARALSLYTNA